MKPWDERVYEAVALKRSAFFRPLAAVLAKLGISPDMLSYAGLAAMVGFLYNLVIWNWEGDVAIIPTPTLWWLLAVLIFDQLDGALARYNHADSHRGKFVDVVVDSTTFSIFMVAVIHAGLVGAATGALLIYFALLSRVLMIIRKNIDRKSEWLFYAASGPVVSTVIYACYGIFAIDTLAKTSYLYGVLQVFVLILAAKSVLDFRRIRYR